MDWIIETVLSGYCNERVNAEALDDPRQIPKESRKNLGEEASAVPC